MSDYANGFIDFHAHILPGADHGSDNIKTSMVQLASALDVGISTVIATPHFYPERHDIEKFITKRERCYMELLNAYTGSINIIPAAEVLLCEGLNNLTCLDQLCIRNTKSLLIEMPNYKWTSRLIDTLFAIKEESNLNVILVHVDRYPAEDVNELLNMGFAGQLNAESLINPFGRKKFVRWIEKENIVALGSDIHGNGSQYISYKKAMGILKNNGIKLQMRMQKILQTNI